MWHRHCSQLWLYLAHSISLDTTINSLMVALVSRDVKTSLGSVWPCFESQYGSTNVFLTIGQLWEQEWFWESFLTNFSSMTSKIGVFIVLMCRALRASFLEEFGSQHLTIIITLRCHMKMALSLFDLCFVKCPCLCTVQEFWGDDAGIQFLN